jgi:peroxiredoxin
MKKCYLFVLLMITTAITFAQSIEADPVNKQRPYIPAFNLLSLNDSTIHINEKLKKNKAVMIILFDPDCEHCFNFAKELVKNRKKFSNAQVIMSSFGSLPQIKSFYKKTGLSQLSNLIIGQDNVYFFASFYKISKYPFAALYNNNHKLISAYEQTIDVKQMAQILAK